MAKLFYLALTTMLMGIVLAHRGGQSWYGHLVPSFLSTTPSTICTVPKQQVEYLTKMLNLMNNLQANATYNPVFQIQWANFISYMKNPISQALLYSNCTRFVEGLKDAQLKDKAAERTRQRISDDIKRQIQQVPRDVTANSGVNDMDV